ncbi:MAG: GNAT family N-acetyltransferase [Woeseiaceae bacterium]|nr:GNAT family N-acetyltransferase [Woeseiaceae bacterium]
MDSYSTKPSDFELVRYTDPESFRRVCLPWLLEAEDVNNTLLGMIDLMAEGSSVYRHPFFLGTLVQSSQIVGCCAFALPDGLLVSDMPKLAARILFQGFTHTIGVPKRIAGPPEIADLFASSWRSRKPTLTTELTVWSIWRVDGIPENRGPAKGLLRLGVSSDEQLVTKWGQSYGEEKSHAPIDVGSFMLRKLRRKELYVWEDSGPATIVTLSGRTENSVKISAVYTPAEKRGAGYATKAVAELVKQEILAGRKFLTLVTDDADNHLDRMYRRLGFERVGTRHSYAIDLTA